MRAVCRSFDAQAFLHSHSHTSLHVTPHTAALLPYLPLLESMSTAGGEVTCFWTALLGNAASGMPGLTSLDIQSVSRQHIDKIVTAVESNTQLTRLSIALSPGEEAGHVYPPCEIRELPVLPCLRQLRVWQPFLNDEGEVAIQPIQLNSLSALQLLTCLLLDTHEPKNYFDGHDTSEAMQPVCSALSSLRELRHLETASWAMYPEAGICWQALALAAPKLEHLTHLQLHNLLLPEARPELPPEAGPAVCAQHLSAALAGLPLLKALVLQGACDAHEHWQGENVAHALWLQQTGYPVVSDVLARSIGTLSGLTHLELSRMRSALRAHDCYLHLSGLTNLRCLELLWGASSPPPTGVPAGGATDAELRSVMLSGMTQLSRLSLEQFSPTVRADAELLSETLGALPLLQWLHTARTLDRAGHEALAWSIRYGRLPVLATATGATPQECSTLNTLALRRVFS